VEGENLVVEARAGAGTEREVADAATELARLPVDVFVASGAQAVEAARAATTTIPIVMVSVSEPVRRGFVESLARPGGNVTGLSNSPENASVKQLELLKEAIPALSRVAVLWHVDNPSSPMRLEDLQAAAPALGVELVPLEVRSPADFERLFEQAAREGAEALHGVPSILFSEHYRRIVALAARHQLPGMYWGRSFVEAGGLMAYAVNAVERYRAAGAYVDKILKGAKPGNLPVEQAREFEFVINLKTAQALGLTMPPHVLAQATEVLQ
jgi:putative ABC transport system substrate-binding protein